MGPKYVSVLEKVFGVFYNCGTTLGRLLRHHELIHSVEELQATLTTTYVELLKLVTGITLYYSRRHLGRIPVLNYLEEINTIQTRSSVFAVLMSCLEKASTNFSSTVIAL